MRLISSYCADMARDFITRFWSWLSGPMVHLSADSDFRPAGRWARLRIAIGPSACCERLSEGDTIAFQTAGIVFSSPVEQQLGLHWPRSMLPSGRYWFGPNC